MIALSVVEERTGETETSISDSVSKNSPSSRTRTSRTADTANGARTPKATERMINWKEHTDERKTTQRGRRRRSVIERIKDQGIVQFVAVAALSLPLGAFAIMMASQFSAKDCSSSLVDAFLTFGSVYVANAFFFLILTGVAHKKPQWMDNEYIVYTQMFFVMALACSLFIASYAIWNSMHVQVQDCRNHFQLKKNAEILITVSWSCCGGALLCMMTYPCLVSGFHYLNNLCLSCK